MIYLCTSSRERDVAVAVIGLRHKASVNWQALLTTISVNNNGIEYVDVRQSFNLGGPDMELQGSLV